MKIIINTDIEADAMRYPTVGDWYYDETGVLHIDSVRVVALKNLAFENSNYGLLVSIHELVEAIVCRYQNVSQSVVEEWNKYWNSHPEQSVVTEPGDDDFAPYHDAHVTATTIENIMATKLGVNWIGYENALTDTFESMLEKESTSPKIQGDKEVVDG